MKSRLLLTAILFMLAVKAAFAAVPTFSSFNPSLRHVGMITTIKGSNPGSPTNAGRRGINNMQTPTVQASNVNFANTSAVATTGSWTNGNGTARAVFISKGSSGNPAPVNNTTYTANAAFGSGTQIGSTGWYCVYNGTSTVVSITGLTTQTTYIVMVVEYSGAAGSEQYLTTAGTDDPETVTTISPPTISYSSPQTYSQGVAITPLVPTSSGVGPDAYSYNPVSIGSGFSGPTGVAVDAAGNVYVADYGNKLVKKIPVGGGTPVVVGSGFTSPIAVALGPGGNLYVADYGSHSIFKVPVGGGSPVNLGSNFSGPTGIAVDGDGDVYVADPGNQAVYELLVGGGQVTIGINAFLEPNAVAIDAAGNVYVADAGDGTLKEIPAGTNFTFNIFGSGGPLHAVAVDISDNIFVTINNDTGIEEYMSSTGNRFGFETSLSNPGGMAIDAAGNLYVADQGNNAVKKISPTGGYYLNKALPLGLSFDNTTGIIRDTPTEISPATNYTITAYNLAGSASAIVNIAVLTNSANLSDLQLSQGTLTPAFATATTTYTASVANSITSIMITPTAGNADETILVNNAAVSSGSPSGAIPLNVGSNTITVLVTASNGVATKTYTITVTRAQSANNNLANLVVSSGALSPAFGTATSYKNNVGNGVHFTLTPTVADATATLTINGSAATSGMATAIPLIVGNNTVSIVVKAQNGSTKTYTVTVNEARSSNNTLLSLKTSGGLAQGQVVPTTLTESVPNATSSITVTPTMVDNTATVTVNGTQIPSGHPSAAIALGIGGNTITIVGTAQNGSTLTYTLTVTRAKSASLSNLTLSTGSLNPAFATGTVTYDAGVGNGVSSITVTPTAVDPNAVIKVNGGTVPSGSASQSIALPVGNSNITIAVTSADNVSTITYTVKVNRALSSDDALFSLKTNAGLAIGKTVPAMLTENVTNGTSGLRVTPTVDDATAKVTVNSTAVSSGSQSASIPLAVGETNITVIVTAQNGATQTYTLTVTRAPAPPNTVYQPVSEDKPNGVGVQNFELLIADDGITVHQSISPNGDGINDFLQIDNISQFPDNKLSIMNRNGQLVFEARGYDNAAKAFDGHSNKTGQMQLPGTYFYELDYTAKGVVKHKTGFLVLKY